MGVALLAGALIVGDIEAISLPAYPVLLRLLDRVNQRLHPLIVVRVWFHKVDDVEAIDFVLYSIFDTEEIPLSEAIRAIVILKKQIVLEIIYLDSPFEICTLESTFEDERFIVGNRLLQLIVWLQVFIVAIEPGSPLLTIHVHLAADGLLAGPWLLGAVAGRLLQVVGEIHGVEVVALLVRLIDLALILLIGSRQLYQFTLINVWVLAVGSIIIVWTVLDTVVYYRV